MKRLNLFFAICLMFIGFNSCQKDDGTTTSDEVTLSQQETQAEEILSDVDLLTDEAVDTNINQLKSATTANNMYLTDCPVVTINTESSPEVLTIDFGTSCTGADGKVRSGKIIVTSDSFKTFPSVRDKTFDNYFVDGKGVTGTVVKTILKDKENNIRTAEISEDVTIVFPDNGGTATRKADLTRQYDRGVLGLRNDNQIVSWGTVEFTHVSGVKMTKTITSDNPLVYKIACHQIVSGIVSFVTSNNKSWTIDYGDGDCDAQATITIGNKSIKINFR